MRSSILFAGALLARTGCAVLPMPGGCAIGERAIDLHVEGLRKLGAEIKSEDGKLYCHAKKLIGTDINLRFPSVGATENILIAACAAEGITTISNAAREPEIVCLARFLRGIGAKIHGEGSDTILVTGMPEMARRGRHVYHHIMPDRIVAGTYLLGAAITGGDVELRDINTRDLIEIAAKLRGMGCKMKANYDCLELSAPPRLKAVDITTAVHPGFPTDMQSQFMAALAIAEGTSHIRENIFNNRFSHAHELAKMGAKIKTDGSLAEITGTTGLTGTTVQAHDLRCGAALILAGMAAEGETIVTEAQYVMRGYERIEKNLRSLGIDIRLEKSSIS
jgi:UDP-N-acetylglucosamine 1-carboxyvinyltransferase